MKLSDIFGGADPQAAQAARASAAMIQQRAADRIARADRAARRQAERQARIRTGRAQ